MIGLRESDDEPVVGPHRLYDDAGFRARAFDGGHGPWRMDLATEGREHADPPVAELVAAAFDENRAVVGHVARGRRLITDVANEILRGLSVEMVMLDQALNCR